MRKRIGVVSISPAARDHRGLPFERFYESFGKNTGNYMFTQSMFRQFDADMEHIGFNYTIERVNKELDHIVIPAANWLNKTANWDFLTDNIKNTDVPISLIGIGLQAHTKSIAEVKVSESAFNFVRTLADRSPYISVRGDFTRDWLHSVGIKNVVTTGCPSLYMNLLNPRKNTTEGNGIVFQSTRYDLPRVFLDETSVNRELFALAAKLNTHIIYQSEVEEMRYLLYPEGEASAVGAETKILPDLYRLDGICTAREYVMNKGRVFFDIQRWSDFVAQSNGVIGTRLHGSIVALNSGVPAVLLPHDSRTAEVAEFAKIPMAEPSCVTTAIGEDDVMRILSQADTDSYYLARTRNAVVYKQFLSECKIPILDSAFFQ